MLRNKIISIFILLCLSVQYTVPVYAQSAKHPDYAYEYVGNDKWEKFNRKIFNFNLILNKYAIRPIHILWASIIPKYGMDRIKGVAQNIEYPIRVVSSLIQKDFGAVKTETIRFLTNSTLGLGGMFDPARYFFHMEQVDENMEQALAKCKVKQGNYLVLPVIFSSSMRDALGRILDTALNPGSYVGTPVLAAVKAGLAINRTAYMQPLITMVESTFADPYMIAKQAFGLERHLKLQNFDRISLSDLVPKEQAKETKILTENKPVSAPIPTADKIVDAKVISPVISQGYLQGGANLDNYGTENFTLTPDIILEGYNPQNPIVDSMRTALFALPDVKNSIWSDYSIWNRCFANKIKTSSVNMFDGRENYNFRYILQKDANSPLAIIYPSIGEGITSDHSVLFAKIFYDAGYSVAIIGSHFQWEFVKSMPSDYRPGLPQKDAKYLRLTTRKVIDKLEKKYDKHFDKKVIIGTSFGAYQALFVAKQESEDNTLGDVKYISICPPVELLYAMNQVDKNSSQWQSDNFKDNTAVAAAKVLKLYNIKNEQESFSPDGLPFDEYEGKLITGFVMHQKLSDLIYTIENGSKNPSQAYEKINNMDFKDYMEKYMLNSGDIAYDDLAYETGLGSISDFLENSDNYRIYHSVNDYLTNSFQLKKLKTMAGNKMKLFDNGSHLGFMYRNEFISEIKDLISLK